MTRLSSGSPQPAADPTGSGALRQGDVEGALFDEEHGLAHGQRFVAREPHLDLRVLRAGGPAPVARGQDLGREKAGRHHVAARLQLVCIDHGDVRDVDMSFERWPQIDGRILQGNPAELQALDPVGQQAIQIAGDDPVIDVRPGPHEEASRDQPPPLLIGPGRDEILDALMEIERREFGW
jgi:hypothetical protein